MARGMLGSQPPASRTPAASHSAATRDRRRCRSDECPGSRMRQPSARRARPGPPRHGVRTAPSTPWQAIRGASSRCQYAHQQSRRALDLRLARADRTPRAAASTAPACRARRRCGPARRAHSKASSWMIAARLSPMPPVRESSWTISTLWQWRATREHARRDRAARACADRARSPRCRPAPASRRRAAPTCTYAPYEMIARSSPARRSAARPSGIGVGRRVGERLLDARIAIERDVLVVEHRIGIGDGGRHQRARVVRRRRARRSSDPACGRTRPRCSGSGTGRRGAARPTACARPSARSPPQR